MTLFVDILVIFPLKLLVHLMAKICLLFLTEYHYIELQYYQNFQGIYLHFFLIFYNVQVYFVFLLHLHHFHFHFDNLHFLNLFDNKFLLLFLYVVYLSIYILLQHFCHFQLLHYKYLFQII